jgi:hypothetical protein
MPHSHRVPAREALISGAKEGLRGRRVARQPDADRWENGAEDRARLASVGASDPIPAQGPCAPQNNYSCDGHQLLCLLGAAMDSCYLPGEMKEARHEEKRGGVGEKQRRSRSRKNRRMEVRSRKNRKENNYDEDLPPKIPLFVFDSVGAAEDSWMRPPGTCTRSATAPPPPIAPGAGGTTGPARAAAAGGWCETG